MRAFKNIVKAVSGKSSKNKNSSNVRNNEITTNIVNGIKKVLTYMEIQPMLPKGLYKEPGFAEEIEAIESLIESGKISETYLSTVRSTHSISMAIINVLASHDPIIPQSLYDHFMSPLANLDALIDDLILKSPLFDLVMGHLRMILNNKNIHINISEIASNIGIHMLRAVEDDIGFDSQSFESPARIKTFERILQHYISGKEESERFFASANTPNRRSPSLNIPTANSHSPIRTENTTISSPTISAAILNPGTIQERSVKVVFSDPNNKPSQDELGALFARYGHINNIGYKDKLAVVLFATKREAQACARDQEAAGTLKVKYLGGALDPVPVAAPPVSSTAGLTVLTDTLPSSPDSPSPAKIFQYSEGNIKHYTTFADSQPQDISVHTAVAQAEVATQSHSKAPDGMATSVDLHNTTSISIAEIGPGWANTSRSSHRPVAADTSQSVNTSVVSDYSPPVVARKQMNTTISSHDEGERANISIVTDISGTERMRGKAAMAKDLSMVSFADLQEATGDTSRISHTGRVSEPARRTERANDTDASAAGNAHWRKTAERLQEQPRFKEAEEEDQDSPETYPSAPGSASAGFRPTHSISPIRTGQRDSGSSLRPEDHEPQTHRDSTTSSGGGSWKSAQPTWSPTANTQHQVTQPSTKGKSKPEGRYHDDTSSDTADDTHSDTTAEAAVHPQQQSNRDRKSTPPRSHSQYNTTTSRSRSSSEDDRLQSNRSGQGDIARFSTETVSPYRASVQHEGSRWEANMTSPGSDAPTSGGSSVKKRQIRTIHVGSPLNSSENAATIETREEEFGNFLQEEQSEIGRRSRSGSEVANTAAAPVYSQQQSSDSWKDQRSQLHTRLHALDVSRTEESMHTHTTQRRGSEASSSSTARAAAATESKRSPSKQDFITQPPFTRSGSSSPGKSVQLGTSSERHEPHTHTSTVVHTQQKEEHDPQRPAWEHSKSAPVSREHTSTAAAAPSKELQEMLNALQQRLFLLEAQVRLGTESEELRRSSQTRLEERWAAEVLALNLRNLETTQENTRLQEELQKWKIECTNTQAALTAAEAGRKSLLLATEEHKNRAEHEALDTVITQKRLITSLEQHLQECKSQIKTLESEVGFMREKQVATTTSLLSWRSRAMQLTENIPQEDSPIHQTEHNIHINSSSSDSFTNTNTSKFKESNIKDAIKTTQRKSDISAHFIGADESHIPDTSAYSQVQLEYSRDNSFRTNSEDSDNQLNGISVVLQHQQQPLSAEQTTAAERVNESKPGESLSVQRKLAQQLLALSQHSEQQQVGDDRQSIKEQPNMPGQSFQPSPLYADLLYRLQERDRNSSVGGKITPAATGRTTAVVFALTPNNINTTTAVAAGSTADNTMLDGERPDVTEGFTENNIVNTRKQPASHRKPTTTTTKQAAQQRVGTMLGKFQEGNEKLAELLSRIDANSEQKNNTKFLKYSPFEPYTAAMNVPNTTEDVRLYEQRLREVMSDRNICTPSSAMLTRSAQYADTRGIYSRGMSASQRSSVGTSGSLSWMRSGDTGRSYTSTTAGSRQMLPASRSLDAAGTSRPLAGNLRLSATTPAWAQYKYE